MQDTFQLSFQSHTGLKRKYCFSVPDRETLARWTRLLSRQIATTKSTRLAVKKPIREAAEGVALQVLRDALIAPEVIEKGKAVRSGSISVALEESNGALRNRTGYEGKGSGILEVQTGKELVLVCRQNSLLPGLLELLQAGIGGAGSAAKPEETTGTSGLNRMISVREKNQGGRI
jgi:hypothetical protein